jgi:recombination protein RecA
MSAKKTKKESDNNTNGGHSTMGIDTDRSKAMDLAITQIERQFGKGSIMKLGGGEKVADIPAISTGSLSLDIALGTFGVPRGRVVEI